MIFFSVILWHSDVVTCHDDVVTCHDDVVMSWRCSHMSWWCITQSLTIDGCNASALLSYVMDHVAVARLLSKVMMAVTVCSSVCMCIASDGKVDRWVLHMVLDGHRVRVSPIPIDSVTNWWRDASWSTKACDGWISWAESNHDMHLMQSLIVRWSQDSSLPSKMQVSGSCMWMVAVFLFIPLTNRERAESIQSC